MQKTLALPSRPLLPAPVGGNATADPGVDLVGVAIRRWPQMLAVTLLVPLLALALTALTPREAEVTTRVLYNVTPAEEAIETRSLNAGVLDRSIENAIEVSSGDAVRLGVADALGLELDELPEILVSTEAGTDVLLFTIRGTGREQDAAAANAWAAAFLDVSRIESVTQIDLAVAGLEERRTVAVDEGRDTRAAALEARIVELETERELIASGSDRIVAVAEPATPPPAPLIRNFVFAAAAGLFLAGAAGLMLDARDRTVRSAADLADVGVPLLGTISHIGHLTGAQVAAATLTAPGSRLADDHHRLRAAFEGLSHEAKLVAVVSHEAGIGRTATASNLAAAFSSAGERTVLVDADLRAPGLAPLLQLGERPGLTEWIDGRAELTEVARRIDRRGIDMAVIPAGRSTPNGAALISSKQFASAVAELESEADRIVFDTSAMAEAADAAALCGHVDAVVLVARVGASTIDDITDDLATVARSGGDVIGIALIGEPTTNS